MGQKAAAYLCDGDQVEAWLRGTVTGDEISLTGKNGATLEAKLDGSALSGDVEIGDEKLDFTLREAEAPGRALPGQGLQDHDRLDRAARRLDGGDPDHG